METNIYIYLFYLFFFCLLSYSSSAAAANVALLSPLFVLYAADCQGRLLVQQVRETKE